MMKTKKEYDEIADNVFKDINDEIKPSEKEAKEAIEKALIEVAKRMGMKIAAITWADELKN